MIRRGIQRVEAMPFVLDIRPIRKREPHPMKDADGAVEHLGERMKGSDLMRRAGERDVDPGERADLLRGPQFFPGLRRLRR